MTAPYLPLFVNVQGLAIAVAGSGADAEAMERRLSELGARVTRASDVSHLDGALLLVVTEGDAPALELLLAGARERGLLAASLGGGAANARVGASAGLDGVVVAASTSGASPELDAHLAREAARALTPAHERFAEICGSLRQKLAERFPDDTRRDAIWQQIFESPVLAMLQSGLDDEAVELAERMAWGTG